MKGNRAWRIAYDRWTTPDRARVGKAWRRRRVDAQFEVGFVCRSGQRGGMKDVVLGRGQTWEEAFAQADARNGVPL